MNVIIYSYNSPIKLHALLSSIRCFSLIPLDIYVYPMINNKSIDDGYNRVLEEFNNFKFIKFDEIEKTILSKPHIMELNDSNIFTRHFKVNPTPIFNNPTIVTYSTILGSNIYGAPKNTMYNYKNYFNEFGDIWMSGNIYNSHEYLNHELIPNNKNKVYFETQSCLVDVFTTQNKWELNEEFLKGKIIDIAPFIYLDNKTITIDTEYNLKWRSN